MVYPQGIRMNLNNNHPNEMSLAINPLDNRFVVAASNINNLYLSSDSGRTWVEKEMESSFGVYGDPVVKYDHSGRLYIAHLAKNSQFKKTEESFYGALDRIVVQCSYDNGQTFNDGNFCGFTDGRMQDKPWLTFDLQNNIYIAWTEFDKYGSKDQNHHSRIRFFKTNVGWTDTMTTTISDIEGNCEDGDSTPEGATLAFGLTGEVFCSWAAFGKIYIDCSKNGGRQWSHDIVVCDQRGGWTLDIPFIYRTNGLPFLVDDNKGRLYIVFSEQCAEYSSCTQSRLVSSIDGGVTWKSLRLIDQDPVSQNHFSFTPNIRFNEANGKLGVIYYESFHSPSGKFVKAIGMESDSSMEHFKYSCLSAPFPMTGKDVFFGDYVDISFSKDLFYASWNQPDSEQMAAYISPIKQKNVGKSNLPLSLNPFRLSIEGTVKKLMLHSEFEVLDKIIVRYKKADHPKYKYMKVEHIVRSIAEYKVSQFQEIILKTSMGFGNNFYDFIITVNDIDYEYTNLYIPCYKDLF